MANLLHETVIFEGNRTYDDFSSKSRFPFEGRYFKDLWNVFEHIIGGGNGGPGDENDEDDFRPGGGLFPPFFELDFDPLMFYDLQWSPPEDLSLVPKKWYEDEDLVVAWNRIKAKQVSCVECIF